MVGRRLFPFGKAFFQGQTVSIGERGIASKKHGFFSPLFRGELFVLGRKSTYTPFPNTKM